MIAGGANHLAARQMAADYIGDAVDDSQRTVDEEEDDTEEEREPNGPAPTGAGQTGGILGPRPFIIGNCLVQYPRVRTKQRRGVLHEPHPPT